MLKNANALLRLTDICDIYFEGLLISKEQIIKEYASFLASTLSNEDHSVSIALHTGSVCFDIVSALIAAFGCLVLDVTTPEQVISSLNIGDMVMYKSQRYRWRGIKCLEGQPYLVLEQDGRGQNGKAIVSVPYESNKNLIKPYFGRSELTDGRGIRREKANRASFISNILDVSLSEIPGIAGLSTVVVSERRRFERIVRGIEIVYDGDKRIGFLDAFTASYYTEGGEEHQYGNNPAKIEPVLKITGNISTARDLVLDRRGNKTVGLVVLSSSIASKENSELADLLGRKRLRFVHVAEGIYSDNAAIIVDMQEDAAVFACTKEFLLQKSLPVRVSNHFTFEMDRQIDNILKNSVAAIGVEGGFSWDKLRNIKKTLWMIQKSEWNDGLKNDFIISAYSLLKLFLTAVFSMDTLEVAIKEGQLDASIISPALKINKLWELAESAGMMEYQCAYIVDELETFYKKNFDRCLKYDALKQHLEGSNERKIAVVVPKAYYIELLVRNEIIRGNKVTITTANRFDNSIEYDEVIAVGDFYGKRFNPLNCRAASDITILLYFCEAHCFKYKQKQAMDFENVLNLRAGVGNVAMFDGGMQDIVDNFNVGNIEAFNKETLELERYINSINTFDIGKLLTHTPGAEGVSLSSEIVAVGNFINGEHILFSKYYKAIVFDPIKGMVIENDTENLTAGDILVFAKRNNYTQNMVDFIYERLQTTGRLSTEVLNATEKVCYWKEVLREYKNLHNLSYRDIAKRLREFGSSLQEVTIRQWLIEESHIVGPRDEMTLKQIAELTQDPYLLGNTRGYHEACRIVRRQRKEILEIIGKAITYKLSGHILPMGSVLEFVCENVESLSETLELESVVLLDEAIVVPTNLINKPIIEAEVLM